MRSKAERLRAMDDLAKAYELLGVTPEISSAQLRRHYRDLVKRWHPDQHGRNEEERRVADEAFREINRAYQIVMAGRKGADDPDRSEPDPATPSAEPAAEEGATEPEADAPSESRTPWILGLVLLLAVAAVAVSLQFHPRGLATAGRPPLPAAPPPAPQPPPPALLAGRIVVAADDFVVDVWLNGRRVGDELRHGVNEVFGAFSEEIKLDVHEGDWVVFNVANNRFRWGGARYFGAAGMLGPQLVFASNARDGRWTFMEDPDRLRQFIEVRDAPGLPVNIIPQERRFDRGDGQMQSMIGGPWRGDAIWGDLRNTWIKFRAVPTVAPNR